MRKSEILAALERMPGDPEIEIRINGHGIEMKCEDCGQYAYTKYTGLAIDRINEYPRPEIVVIEK